MNNLEIGDKVLTFIALPEGGVWVDEKAQIKEGDYYYNSVYHTVNKCKPFKINVSFDYKVIARTPDCDIPNVPVVEVEAVDLKEEVLKFIKHWELYFSSPKVGQPPSLQILKDVVDKAAQSQGAFTEAQVRKALAMSGIRDSNGNLYPYDSILQSLKPNIVVETDWVTHSKCSKSCAETEGFKGTEHEGLDMCEDGCVLGSWEPITFKGEDGRTHLKIKTI